MKHISGFTFIKNGLTLGYPILESVRSIDPICDEVIINVGFDNPELINDDGTYEYLRDSLVGEKYKFVKSWWDPNKTKHGLILSEQTNIALQNCEGKYCQYIQGDECIHEEDLELILSGTKEMDLNSKINGLVFNYLHFYGNVDIYKYTRNLYRREVRLIRNHLGIKSWLDAQGFRDSADKKIYARLIEARIFHYGWARQEQIMKNKVKSFEKLYHGEIAQTHPEFNYVKTWGLKNFEKSHPLVMKNWINQHKNSIDLDKLPLTWDWNLPGLVISDLLESVSGYRLGEYKNYKLL